MDSAINDAVSQPLTHHVSPIESAMESSTLHDSMVTVRLSEPPHLPALTVNTATNLHKVVQGKQLNDGVAEYMEKDAQEEQEESPRITMMNPNGEVVSPSGSESGSENGENRRESDSSEGSDGEVNWGELEKTEEQEPRDEASEDVSLPAHQFLRGLC